MYEHFSTKLVEKYEEKHKTTERTGKGARGVATPVSYLF